MKNSKLFIYASILLMLSVLSFFTVNYPEICNEFPKYDPVYHVYVPKSEIIRQEEMRFKERFPNYLDIVLLKPLFLYFSVFSVVFFALFLEVPEPKFKFALQLLIEKYNNDKPKKNKRLISK